MIFGSKNPPKESPRSTPEQEYAEQTYKVLDSLSRDMEDHWGLSGGKSIPARLRIYNPSKLVGKKGLQIYDDMLRDGQVKNTYFLRRLCLLATARTVVAEDPEDPDAVYQKEFIDYCFKMMRGSVENFILKITDAIRCGYKVAEKNYMLFDEGEFAGLTGLESLIVRNSRNYEFETDEHGRLLPDGLIEGKESADEARLPIEKFIIWSYGGLDDDGASLYGMSEFEAAYRYYYGNEIIHRVWAALCERYVKPMVTAEEQESSTLQPDDPKVSGLLTKIANLHRVVGLWVPKWAKITIHKPVGGNTEQCHAFMDFNNQMISKSLLLGTLIQQEGKAGGSYALGQKQFDLFYLNNAQIMRQIEQDIFYEQIIKDLINKNFKNPKYPQFKLIEPQDAEEMKAKAVIMGILGKIPWLELDEEMIREFIGLRQSLSSGETNASSKESSKEPATTKKEKENPTEDFAEFSREITENEKIINFKDVDRRYNQIPASAKPAMSQAYKKSVDSIISQAKKKGLLENGYEIIHKIVINPGEFKKVYTDLVTRAYIAGTIDAQGEVDRHNNNREFAEPAAAVIETRLEHLYEIAPYNAGDLSATAIMLNNEAFMAAGAEAGGWSTKVRYTMSEAIDQRWTMERFMEELETLGVKQAERAALETGYLTETSRVYNRARMDIYDRTDSIVGYIFSALLDNRTTEICRELDGKMWAKGDEGWQEYFPPLHFRCRSIIGPVFRGREPEEWDTPPPDLTPAEGFGGPVGATVKPAQSTQHSKYN